MQAIFEVMIPLKGSDEDTDYNFQLESLQLMLEDAVPKNSTVDFVDFEENEDE